MQKFLLFFILTTPVFAGAQENMCSIGPVAQTIEKVQNCLKLDCPSKAVEQARSLGSDTAGVFSLNSSISAMKKLFIAEQAKAPILSCEGNCNFHYVPAFRLRTAPTESIDNQCGSQFVDKTYHLEYKSRISIKNGKKDSCRPSIEKRAGDFIQNVLLGHKDKIVDDEKTLYNGGTMSSAEFSKQLSSKLCPGDCSLYSIQSTAYDMSNDSCAVKVDLDVTCGKAKKSMNWTITAEIVEHFQCVQP